MRKTVYLILMGALLLGLASCADKESVGTNLPGGPETSAPTPDQAVETIPTPIPTPEPIFLLREADVPPGEYEPWQEAYADFLRQLRQEEGEIEKRAWSVDDPSEQFPELWQALLDSSNRYALYDVDKDGVPELFVRHGNGEDEFYWDCYTFQNGNVVETEGILSDTEIIPDYRMTNRGFGLSEPCPIPLLLPIYDYGALPREKSAPMEEAEVRAAIGKVLWKGAELFGASGDGSPVDMGMGTLEEYLAMVSEHGPDPVNPVKYAWADVNGDGQTDCILQGTEVDGLGFLNVDNYIVLSVEEDTVYAYFYGSDLRNIVVTADGTVYFDAGFDRWDKESFYKNQCYRYLVQPPAEWDDLAWEEFPQPLEKSGRAT